MNIKKSAVEDITVAALRAAEQCIEDFLEAYRRDCARLVLDEAAKSLRDDALKRVKAALRMNDEEQQFEMRDELLLLREWAKMALSVLQHGAELMPPEQLRQWEGVRAVVESAPVD